MPKKMLCCAAVIILVLTGCAPADRALASDLVYRALTECGSLDGDFAVYIPDACEGGEGYMADGDFYALYYGEAENCGELRLLDDWCVALSSSTAAREIHVLRVRCKSDRAAVCDMLQRRAAALASPELYRPKSSFLGQRPADIRVFVSGMFAVLCAADDCADIEALLS